MSNYINVLRRLERERRAPEAPSSAPPIAHQAMPAPAPLVRESVPTPIAREIVPTPIPIASPPPAAPETPVATFTPPAVEPTVIPLPSVAPPAPSAAPVPTSLAPAPAAEPPQTPVVDTRRARAFARRTHPGVATLLDAIRLISNGRPTRIVVFCGASNAEAVTTLADDLVTHANGSGMPAFLATLTRTANGPALVPAHGSTMDAVLPIDLNGTPSADALAGWSEKVGPDADLVVITGPPLATSIDAALLACATDGLVIVAESEVTERAALQVAAERARIAGCKTLGVVMHGSKNRLPGWLSRLMGDRSESQSS